MVEYHRGTAVLEEASRGGLYESVLTILGVTGTIFPLGDVKHGAFSGSTLTTVGGEQLTVTASKAWNAWDIPQPRTTGMGIPVLDFNGTDEDADTPDAAYFPRASAAWSLGLWIKPDDVASGQTLMAKRAASTLREWECFIDGSRNPTIHIWDDSVPSRIGRRDATVLTADTWVFLGFTDDGSNASSGLNVYKDGAAVDDTDDNSGAFTAMEDLAGIVSIGKREGNSAFFDGSMAGGPLGPFFTQVVLTADQWLRLYEVGRRALNL